MPRVVSNTTPIISLLKINKLYILKELYGTVFVPQAVYYEIEEGKNKPYYCDLTIEPWIIIKEIKNKQSRGFLFDLDEGEAEAIILAKELNAELILLDEKEGRRYAKQLNLTITGTIGILLKAKDRGLIASVKEDLLKLKEKGIWIKQSLLVKALKLADEK